MSEADKVAFALNRLADHALTDALSPRDKASMAVIADCFAEDLQTDAGSEDEPGRTILIVKLHQYTFHTGGL